MHLIFLKLGGSLITDKTRPQAVRADILDRACREILAALRQRPEMRLLVGHGSGSFGHVAAKKYGTRKGVQTRVEWRGFAEVWHAASSLNRIVVDKLHFHGLPAVSFPASAAAIARAGHIESWDLRSLKTALDEEILPVVFGDVVVDLELGGTVLSTEDIFVHLASVLRPDRLLLAGLEAGIWRDFPMRSELVSEITPEALDALMPSFGEAAGTDVTGGMPGKVKQMLELISTFEGAAPEVLIFSGNEPGAIEDALLGGQPGTLLRRPGSRKSGWGLSHEGADD